jgi:hypothetical protein
VIVALYLAIVFAIGSLVILFFSGRLVIGGVPSSIILRFLEDDTARNAYITGDKKKLHDRLDEMGIEAMIKEYYRPQISNEAELDLYIHQILYARTGYIGEAYRVNSEGKLELRN